MSHKLKKKSNDGTYTKVERRLAEEVSAFLFSLGNQFIKVRNAAGAFDCFRYSLDLDPKNQASVYNLGALYSIAGNFEGAYRMFKEASRMRPADSTCQVALAEVARKVGKLDESRELLDSVLRADPNNFPARSAIAVMHYDMGNIAQAMAWNDEALKLKPDDFHLLLNRALINMTYGLWPEWWWLYEQCLSYQKNERMHHLRMSDSWPGNKMPGKTLLVIADQGSGDTIQFSRYVPEAKELGGFARVAYLVQPDTADLVRRMRGIDYVVGFGERQKIDYDAFSSLLGILRLLSVSPDTCRREPHVVTDHRLDEVWRSRISSRCAGGVKKVGLVWAGDPKHGNDHARSIHIARFLPLMGKLPVKFFSFQVGQAVNQLESLPNDELSDVVELGSEFRSFDDTASAMRQMDLLISVDTSVVHLAGCMGVECWLLVPNPPEWRWMLSRVDTAWYGSVRVFRQEKPKEWDPVIRAVDQELRRFCDVA